MDKGRHEHRSDGEKGDAGIEGIERGEQLPRRRTQLCDLPHPPEDHRRIEERIDPRESRDEMIPDNADCQGEDDEAQGHERVRADPLEETYAGEERVRPVLVVEHPAPALPPYSGQFRHGSVPNLCRVRTNGTCETTPTYTPPNTNAIPESKAGWNGVRS
ncbi:MAG TPA: hypothetical protein VIV15_12735, partial [Anaerolineales bacterium]